MSDRDNEIAVATGISVADRERPLQVSAIKIAPQAFSDPAHQDGEDRVELGEARESLVGGELCFRTVHCQVGVTGRHLEELRETA
jgi:hypothetical protein